MSVSSAWLCPPPIGALLEPKASFRCVNLVCCPHWWLPARSLAVACWVANTPPVANVHRSPTPLAGRRKRAVHHQQQYNRGVPTAAAGHQRRSDVPSVHSGPSNRPTPDQVCGGAQGTLRASFSPPPLLPHPALCVDGLTHWLCSTALPLCVQDQGGRPPQPHTQKDGDGWPTQGSNAAHHTGHSHAIKLTHAIKQCTSWQQLQGVVHSAPAFNQLHVTALATRLAALMPAAPVPPAPSSSTHSSSSSTSSSDQLNSDSSSVGSGSPKNNGARRQAQQPLDDGLRALVLHVLGLVHSNVETLDARGIANTVWALARMARALCALCGGEAWDSLGQTATAPVAQDRVVGDIPSLSGSNDGAAELHSHASFLASALLHRAGSSQWRMGFSPQVCKF